MAKRNRSHARATVDAAQLLGAQIARARRERGWTAAELAERVGVSARTITSLENGSLGVALGTAFEAATMLGLPLFGADGPDELAALARREQDVLALLPRRVYPSRQPARDDF